MPMSTIGDLGWLLNLRAWDVLLTRSVAHPIASCWSSCTASVFVQDSRLKQSYFGNSQPLSFKYDISDYVILNDGMVLAR